MKKATVLFLMFTMAILTIGQAQQKKKIRFKADVIYGDTGEKLPGATVRVLEAFQEAYWTPVVAQRSLLTQTNWIH